MAAHAERLGGKNDRPLAVAAAIGGHARGGVGVEHVVPVKGPAGAPIRLVQSGDRGLATEER